MKKEYSVKNLKDLAPTSVKKQITLYIYIILKTFVLIIQTFGTIAIIISCLQIRNFLYIYIEIKSGYISILV